MGSVSTGPLLRIYSSNQPTCSGVSVTWLCCSWPEVTVGALDERFPTVSFQSLLSLRVYFRLIFWTSRFLVFVFFSPHSSDCRANSWLWYYCVSGFFRGDQSRKRANDDSWKQPSPRHQTHCGAATVPHLNAKNLLLHLVQGRQWVPFNLPFEEWSQNTVKDKGPDDHRLHLTALTKKRSTATSVTVFLWGTAAREEVFHCDLWVFLFFFCSWVPSCCLPLSDRPMLCFSPSL